MKRKNVFLTVLAIFILLCSTSYSADFYYLTMNNTTGVPTATSPVTGTIGYIGETHPGWPGYYATQDIQAFPPDGYIFSHWSGDIPAGLEYVRTTVVTMDRNRIITANFIPTKHIKLTTRGYIHSSPLLYDINQDGYREIIIGDMAGYVYCFDYQGNLLWEYYAGDAFNKTVSPVPEWFNPEVKNNNDLGNITIQSSCAAGDIDGDTVPEIICGIGGFVNAGTAGSGGTTTGFGPVGQGGILILNNNGTLKLLIRGLDTFDGLGNPVQDGFSDGFYSTPAIDDLDRDGRLDFVIGGTDQNIYASKIVNKDTSKNNASERVRFYHPPGKDGLWAVPVYELDDDGDGKFNEDPVGDCTPFTYFNSNDDFSGYKNRDDDYDGLTDEGAAGDDDEDSSSQVGYVDWNFVDEDEFEWPFRNIDTVVSSPAIADISDDGDLDIMIGVDSSGGQQLKSGRKFIPTGGALRALTTQAQEIGSFPQWIEQVVWSSPSVIDINNDGDKEVFVGTGFVLADVHGLIGKGLYAFKSDGSSYLTGASPAGLFAETTNIIFTSPAFGDLDGDGWMEVVAADFSGYLYAWDSSGTILPGFPMQPLQDHPGDPGTQIRSSPILADIDSDGLPEIVLGAGWSIIAVNGDGSIVPAFEYGSANFTTGTTSVYSTPAAADLDNNGKIDLVWATGESSDGGVTVDNGVIHIWEPGDFNYLANPWPMFKRTGTRTSAYTIQIENPIYDPMVSQADEGDSLKVSVFVYPGLSQVSTVNFNIEINGTLIQATMLDNGLNGDAAAGDGRYTSTMQLPDQIDSIGNVSFDIEALNGETITSKVSAVFTHINILALVTWYYESILNRPPDQQGLNNWVWQIERIMTLGIDVKEGFIALGKTFFNSQEYINRGRTDDEYVTDLYWTFLHRAPDQGGFDDWTGKLGSGFTRNMVLNAFMFSEEFKLYMADIFGESSVREEYGLVNDQYRGFLGRLPDDGGFDHWLQPMQTAQCDLVDPASEVRQVTFEIVNSFLVSQEYINRNRSNRECVEDYYDAIMRRAPELEGYLHWLGYLDAETYTCEELLPLFVDAPEFQLRVQDVIDAGCIN